MSGGIREPKYPYHIGTAHSYFIEFSIKFRVGRNLIRGMLSSWCDIRRYKLPDVLSRNPLIKIPHLFSAWCLLGESFSVANNRCPFLGISMVEAFALLCSEIVDNRMIIVIYPLSSRYYHLRWLWGHSSRTWCWCRCAAGANDCGGCLFCWITDDIRGNSVRKWMCLHSCFSHIKIDFVPKREICL